MTLSGNLLRNKSVNEVCRQYYKYVIICLNTIRSCNEVLSYKTVTHHLDEEIHRYFLNERSEMT